MLDLSDIPLGMLALDALVKEAGVDVLSAGTVQDGRYLILFGGEVEAVSFAFEKAVETAGHALRDAVLLPWAEARIVPAILDNVIRWPAPGDTLGVVQNGSAPSMLKAIDAALKGAWVDLVQLRIGEGLGGRAIATLWGETHDVEAALELAASAAADPSWTAQVIRNADDAVTGAVVGGSQFFKEWRG